MSKEDEMRQAIELAVEFLKAGEPWEAIEVLDDALLP